MRATIQKWGNSQGLRIPKHVLKEGRISVGDDVEVSVKERQIVIKKISRPRFDLAEMVARMPRNYRVREESFGKPVGKEAW